jgi:outer membrane protein TolC
MHPRYVFSLPIAALVLLAGCDVGNNVTATEDLDASVAAMMRGDVTRVESDDATMRTAVRLEQGYSAALRRAILENPRFTASIRRYREAGAGIQISQSAARPQLTAGATAGGIAGGNDSGVRTGVAANISLSQLVFDGGATRAEVAGATAQAYAARANIAATGNDVGRDAALVWIDLWQANTHLSLLNQRLREVSPMIERIERLITNGIVDRAALAAAERQFLDLKLEEERLTAALRDSRERFNRFYGSRPSAVAAPQRLFSDTELAQMANNWQDAPSLIAAAAELIVAERAVDAAQARTRPTVNVRAGASSPISRSDRPDANVGLVLQHTFSDGGRRAAEIERLNERLQAGRATFEDIKSSARVDVETALSRHRSLRGTISVLEAQIRSLDTERETLRSQIASGQANLRQLVEAEVSYYRAQARLIEVRGELSKLEIALASQTGQLTRKLNIDIDALL